MATGVEPHEPALVDSTQAYPTFVLLDTAARPENAPDVDGKAARHEAVLLRDPVALEHTGPGAAVDAMDTESVHLTVDGGGSSNRGSTKLGVLRLAALLFFSVSGGPVGTEGLIQAAGPFCSLIGLLVLPLFWCLPVGLMTAELATAFPKDGGYVLWVNAAFGGFGGFMMGWISWASGVVDTAIYPGMFVSFVRHGLHVKMSHQARSALLVGFNVVLSSSNLLGIGIAGDASLFFSAVVLLPVVILMLVSLPDMDPAAWLQSTPAPDWVHWINIAIWNTNGFDTISTFAGEVCTPMRTFPAAIVLGGLAVILPYVISIMAATAVNQDYGSYENGTYNLIAVKEGGWFVGMLFTVSTCAAAAGMYVSDITSYSYQLSGMAEEGMLPEILAAKMPGPGTPYVAIGLQMTMAIMLSFLDFHEILMCDNVLYCAALMLELAAMIQLRIAQPNMRRPFQIPAGTTGVCIIMCGPAIICLFVFFTSTAKALALSSLISAVGIGIWYSLSGRPGGRSYSSL